MKDNLSNAVTIAQIDEQDAAVIAILLDPAIERDALTGVLSAKFTTGVGAS